jgi:hypothetical protein
MYGETIDEILAKPDGNLCTMALHLGAINRMTG